MIHRQEDLSTGSPHQVPPRPRQDLLALGLLLLVVLAFLLPLVAQWAPAVFDDCPRETLPGLIATARIVQSGSVPLWDFCTFAGAKPPYVDNAYLNFYLPMYPFFYLANTHDPSQCHRVLMLMPFALHVLWAALGAYGFGRIALRLHPAGALVAALVYGLSPEMGFQLVTPQSALALSHLPWCLLALARFLESGRVLWWLGGTVGLALMSTTGASNYLIRAYFTMAVIVALLWFFLARQSADRVGDDRRKKRPRDRRKGRRWFLFRLLSAGSMFALSISLTGFVWAGTLEAASWISKAMPLTARSAASFSPYSSMHPLNLLTLLVPGFFGDLEARHSWGVGLTLSNHSTLSGGIFLMVALAGALLRWLPRPDGDQQGQLWHRWTWIMTIILIGALLTMMGGYTPVFYGLCAVLPWFFRFPHPVYYRFAVCWSVAVLAGIGVSTHLRAPRPSGRSTPWPRAAGLCPAAALALAAVACFWPTSVPSADGERTLLSLETLTLFGEWSWFLTGPVAYFAVSTALSLALAFPHQWHRYFSAVLCLGISLETIAIAWSVFYGTNTLGTQFRVPPDYLPPSSGRARRYKVERDPAYQLATVIGELARAKPGRYVGEDSILDNAAWYVDGRSLLGYAAKPLIPWYGKMIDRFTSGTNVRRLTQPPGRLLQNLNVRYLVTRGMARYPIEPVRRNANSAVFELPNPLPYVFTQDRVVPLQVEAQLDALFRTDLRHAVYVRPPLARRLPAVGQPRSASPGQDDAARFDALQRANPIKSVDQTRANQILIQAEITRPAMLVINQCWHPGWTALVDGRPAPVHRVNYLQQGVWLERGKHTVQLRFLPRSFSYGLLASALSICFLTAVPAVVLWRTRNRAKAR